MEPQVDILAPAPREVSDEERELARYLLQETPDHHGHARCVLRLFPDRFLYNETHGWFYWTGTHWSSTGGEAAVGRAITATLKRRRQVASLQGDGDAQRLMRKSWADNHVISGVKRRLRDQKEVMCPISKFNTNKDVLNCSNGTVDLRTGEVSPHNPDDLITYVLSYPYDPTANYDDWILWLMDIGMDSEMEQYLKSAMGYTITGHTDERALFYLYGEPAAGKGTFLETLQHVLRGPLEQGTTFNTFTADRGGDRSNFDLAMMHEARFVVASESERRRKMNEQLIKSVTGGDEIFCSFKHKPHFSYFPEFTIWVSSNYKPEGDVEDDAFWARFHLIHFPKSFLGREDKTLKRRMRKAAFLTGVLRWLVEGAQAWYALGGKGLVQPERVRQHLEEHRKELDTVGQFVEQNCEVDVETLDPYGNPRIFTVSSRLYSSYKAWCEEEGFYPVGRARFTQNLDRYGVECKPKKVRNKTRRVYYGVQMVVDEMDL